MKKLILTLFMVLSAALSINATNETTTITLNLTSDLDRNGSYYALHTLDLTPEQVNQIMTALWWTYYSPNVSEFLNAYNNGYLPLSIQDETGGQTSGYNGEDHMYWMNQYGFKSDWDNAMWCAGIKMDQNNDGSLHMYLAVMQQPTNCQDISSLTELHTTVYLKYTGQYEVDDPNVKARGLDSNVGLTYGGEGQLGTEGNIIQFDINYRIDPSQTTLEDGEFDIIASTDVTVEADASDTYEGTQFPIDMARIKDVLGVESYDEITMYALESQGNYNKNKTAINGFWYDFAGNWCTWGDNSVFYIEEVDMANGTFSAGQMAGRLLDVQETVNLQTPLVFEANGLGYRVIVHYNVHSIVKPYAVYNDGTLTFYFNRNYDTAQGDVYTTLRTSSGNSWGVHKTDITNVVFTQGFQNARPTSTTHWFSGCYNLASITGLEYLNTSQVTSMSAMFNGAGKNSGTLTELDLSNFATRSVKNMSYMFNSCPSLKRIYVGDLWMTNNVTNSTSMFNGCRSIVGIDGQTYDANYTDATKAYAGGGGYLSMKGIEMQYAVYNDGILHFYLDDQMFNREGDIYTNLERKKSGDEWGVHKLDVTKVIIEPEFHGIVLSSVANWFNGFKNLTEVEGLGNLETAECYNFYAMFNGCSSLKSLDLSGLDTGYATNMSYMFNGCSGLTELDLSEFGTYECTNMNYMFNGCTSLTTIHVSEGWNTESVTTSTNMFNGCKKLVGQYGDKYNANYVDKTKAFVGVGGYLWGPAGQLMQYAVYNDGVLHFYCDDQYSSREGTVYLNLVRKKSGDEWGEHKLDIVKVIIEGDYRDWPVISTAHWFNGCKNLTEIEGLDNLLTSEVTSMYAMFNGCTSLTVLDLCSFSTRKVKNMGYMFNSCSNLKTIFIYPEIWYTDNVTNSTSMFNGCKSLVGQDGTKYDANYIDKTKAHNEQGGYLTNIFAPMAYAVYADGTLTFYYDNEFNEREGEVYTSIVRKSSSDLWGAHKLDITEVEFDQSFREYRPTSTAHWFNGCKNLTYFSSYCLNTSEVTTMYAMFNGAGTNVKDFSIDTYFDTGKVKNMSYMFNCCTTLTTLDVYNFDTRNVTNMSNMFNGCKNIDTIFGYEFDIDNVTNSTNMFKGCVKLTGGYYYPYDENRVDCSMANDGWFGYFTNDCKLMAYAVYKDNVLTFMCSHSPNDVNGEVYTNLTRKSAADGWGAHKLDIQTVIFDSSFEEARPSSTAHWFNGCKNLMSIGGVEYLNTSEVTNMYGMFNAAGANSGQLQIDTRYFDTGKVTNMAYMFNGCKNITFLDITTFDTSNVTDMSYMFNGCTNLMTIFDEDADFDTSSVTNSTKMFYGCKKLVGGQGFKYNANRVDHTMANCGAEGYFDDGSGIMQVKPDVAISDDDATDINSIKDVDVKNSVYTLSGIFVGKDVDLNTLNKGIYIVNGKKVSIK